MPIFYQQDIDQSSRLAIWKIEEDESFFLEKVPLQKAIHHPHKRLQHLAGRYLLKCLFPEFPVHLIKQADTLKPYLEDELFNFSISHCGDYAAALVSTTGRVGIDIEIPSEKVARISNKFLNVQELDLIKEKGAAPIQNLTLLWSAKEAIFKWWSYGKVDFRRSILLSSAGQDAQGSIPALLKMDRQYELEVHYRLFPVICLAWVMEQ